MRLFTSFDGRDQGKQAKDLGPTKKTGAKSKKPVKPVALKLSEAEVRKKLELRQQENAAQAEVRAKTLQAKQIQAQAEKGEDPKTEKMEDGIRSQVGLNDPSDGATHGKLKSMLSTNAFNFSPKERQALGEILKD